MASSWHCLAKIDGYLTGLTLDLSYEPKLYLAKIMQQFKRNLFFFARLTFITLSFLPSLCRFLTFSAAVFGQFYAQDELVAVRCGK